MYVEVDLCCIEMLMCDYGKVFKWYIKTLLCDVWRSWSVMYREVDVWCVEKLCDVFKVDVWWMEMWMFGVSNSF